MKDIYIDFNLFIIDFMNDLFIIQFIQEIFVGLHYNLDQISFLTQTLEQKQESVSRIRLQFTLDYISFSTQTLDQKQEKQNKNNKIFFCQIYFRMSRSRASSSRWTSVNEELEQLIANVPRKNQHIVA